MNTAKLPTPQTTANGAQSEDPTANKDKEGTPLPQTLVRIPVENESKGSTTAGAAGG